jgi:hypothetical protein
MNAFSTIVALAVIGGVVYMVRIAILQGGRKLPRQADSSQGD